MIYLVTISSCCSNFAISLVPSRARANAQTSFITCNSSLRGYLFKNIFGGFLLDFKPTANVRVVFCCLLSLQHFHLLFSVKFSNYKMRFREISLHLQFRDGHGNVSRDQSVSKTRSSELLGTSRCVSSLFILLKVHQIRHVAMNCSSCIIVVYVLYKPLRLIVATITDTILTCDHSQYPIIH